MCSIARSGGGVKVAPGLREWAAGRGIWRPVEAVEWAGRDCGVVPSVAVVGQDDAPRVRVKVQGRLLTVEHVNRGPDGGPSGGGKRGVVRGFSRASRKRMMEMLAVVDWSKVGRASFWAGTYDNRERVLPTPQVMEDHRRAFLERVRRRFPRVWGLWRKGFDSEGSRRYHPHLHVLFFNLPGGVKDVLDRWWREIVGEAWWSPTACRLEWVRSRRGAAAYLGQYCAKASSGLVYGAYLHGVFEGSGVDVEDGEVVPTGRVWGIHNSEGYERALAPVLAVELPRGRWFVEFKRLGRRKWGGVNGNEWAGFTLFVEDGERWLEAALGVEYSRYRAPEGVACLMEVCP